MAKKGTSKEIKKIADYLRYLTLMAVQRPASGHPGLPLGCAELGILLYSQFIRGSNKDPQWINRDRFVLSAGHGSMFIYALNYLFGYNIRLKDLTHFRKLGSKTPGHPEYELQDGIETTTGPLGQGFTNAVGIALEGKMLQARFNHKDIKLFDYDVYTLMGDGCTMEGVTNEGASLAGHLGLDNLIALYDDNGISIDGDTGITLTEDVGKRYAAMGWAVDKVKAKSLENVKDKLLKLKKVKGKPKLLIVKTVIGEGLDTLKNTAKIHGAAAGIEEIKYFLQNSSMKKKVSEACGGVLEDQKVRHFIETQLKSGLFFDKKPYEKTLETLSKDREKAYSKWQETFTIYKKKHKKKATELAGYANFTLPAELRKALLNYSCAASATRNVSGQVLQLCAKHIPQIVGGSADLVGSTKATIKDSQYVTKKDFSGRNIAFGVREHAMGALGNGLALNNVFIPFTSTFFTFIDYMKPAVRLASIMKIKHLFIFTHDSIYVGEDGPTHEPIEHLGATRLIPDLHTFRPANDVEMAFSYLYFLENKGPAVILGTRQGLSAKVFSPTESRHALYKQFKKGAYVFSDCEGEADIILAGSGSEVSLLADVKDNLQAEGKKVRLVSIPCMELFEKAGELYFEQILGKTTPIFLTETASHRSFKQFYPKRIKVKDIESFGASGNGKLVAEHFGFSVEKLTQEAASMLT